ncbi:hypothetical protein NQ315_016240 [Exocentrus adspersus]|uniref:Reverse transcriptase domain-containing protein n=1 Tax=Exocentrus adspersus TaxID=1586481 RepID=A0AAV8VIL6_9CUCU|nr:hypothetical protein NQ315_016240 [Exocentrus adspersus]
MKPIVQNLHSKGIICINYLDDFLIINNTYEGCLCPAVKYGWMYLKNFEREKFLALKLHNMRYSAYMLLPSNTASAFDYVTEILGTPEIDLFASKDNHKCHRYISWRRDPYAIAVDAFTICWRGYFFYAFPPFSLILRVLQKIINDKAEGILIEPLWQAQPWYPLFNKLIIKGPLGTTPTGGKNYPGSREIIREAFRLRKVPDLAIETILQSLSEGTITQYGSTYRQWWTFCGKIGISPFSGNSTHVIIFMQELLDSSSNAFGTFNAHRSALDLILPTDLANDVVLKRFIKGISRIRPSRPRYNFVWDSRQVLDYLEKAPSTTLKSLSQKLVTLLALTTAHRMQTFSLIRVCNIRGADVGFQILISDTMGMSHLIFLFAHSIEQATNVILGQRRQWPSANRIAER